jgi:hypothetical protein
MGVKSAETGFAPPRTIAAILAFAVRAAVDRSVVGCLRGRLTRITFDPSLPLAS